VTVDALSSTQIVLQASTVGAGQEAPTTTARLYSSYLVGLKTTGHDLPLLSTECAIRHIDKSAQYWHIQKRNAF